MQSIGASVEYGNIQGAVFNVDHQTGRRSLPVRRVLLRDKRPGSPSQPVVLPVSGGSVPSSGYERDRYRDFTTNLGGPVVRDRLWFFGGYQYLRDYDSQPGADPTVSEDVRAGQGLRASSRGGCTPALQLMQSFHEEFWVNPTPPTLVTPFETTHASHASVPSMTFGHLTHTLSSNTVWDVRVGRFAFSPEERPEHRRSDDAEPVRPDHRRLQRERSSRWVASMLDRMTAKAVLNRYQPGWLGGDHRVEGRQRRSNAASTAAGPSSPAVSGSSTAAASRFRRCPAPRRSSGGRFNTTAVFASDSVTVKDRVTVNAGLRFDHSDAISQDVPALDAAGRRDERHDRRPGETVHVERGLAASGCHGKAHRGRPDDAARELRTVQSGRADGRAEPVSPRRDLDDDDGVQCGDRRLHHASCPWSIRSINLALDPNTRTPRTDEYSVGLDREITPRLAAAVAYIRKSGSDFIAWTDVGGQYREETRTLRRRPQPAGVRPHERDRRQAFPADEPRRLLAHV